MHTIFFAATVAILLGLAAPPLVGVARAQEQPQAYVQRMMGEMVAVSKKATAERRTYYVKLLGEDIDWTTPARRALGARFEALAAADRAKLADWSRQSVIGTQSVMEFLQNMIFSSCAVASMGRSSPALRIVSSSVRCAAATSFWARDNSVVNCRRFRSSGGSAD